MPRRTPSARRRMSSCSGEHGGPVTGPPSPPALRARSESARSAGAVGPARSTAVQTSPAGVLVAAVRAGTDAAAAGLRVGDRVLAVNGRTLRDAIDFQF